MKDANALILDRAEVPYPCPEAAVRALQECQRDYPDYDADDWSNAVSDAFQNMSVLYVAWTLAYLADWSLRGIETSLDYISKRAGIAKGTAVKAVKRLEDAGYLVVSRRKATKKDDGGYAQRANLYRLVIPDGPTWSVPDIEPIKWSDDVLDDNHPFVVAWRAGDQPF